VAYVARLRQEVFAQGLRGKDIEAKMLELFPGLEVLRERYLN